MLVRKNEVQKPLLQESDPLFFLFFPTLINRLSDVSLLDPLRVEKVRFKEDALVDHLRMRFSSSKDSNSQEARLQV